MDNQLILEEVNSLSIQIEHLQLLEQSLNQVNNAIDFKLSNIPSYMETVNIIKNLYDGFQKVYGTNGGEGIYKVTFPKGVSGSLAMFKNENSFLGSLVNENGVIGQARLEPVNFDPNTIMMMAMLYSIDKKLDSIAETNKDIYEFLKQKERAKLSGNLQTLTDVLSNYKFNVEDKTYKVNKHILVQEIRRDSAQALELFKQQIVSNFGKVTLFHIDSDVRSILEKVLDNFKDLKLSLYIYSFSTFVEVMLLENYNQNYLEQVISNLSDQAHQYRILYSECYDKIEKASKNSLDSQIAKGMAKVSKVLGKATSTTPLKNKKHIVDLFEKSNAAIEEYSSRKTQNKMDLFFKTAHIGIDPFVDNLNTLNCLHNKPLTLLVSKNEMQLVLDK
jgi:hypothetical protein